MSPLTEGDWGEHFAWLKDEYMRLVKRAVSDLSPEERGPILKDCIALAARMDYRSPEARSVADSPAGVLHLVRLGLRPLHPDLTERAIAEILNTPADKDAAMDALDAANATTTALEEERHAAGPKAPPTS